MMTVTSTLKVAAMRCRTLFTVSAIGAAAVTIGCAHPAPGTSSPAPPSVQIRLHVAPGEALGYRFRQELGDEAGTRSEEDVFFVENGPSAGPILRRRESDESPGSPLQSEGDPSALLQLFLPAPNAPLTPRPRVEQWSVIPTTAYEPHEASFVDTFTVTRVLPDRIELSIDRRIAVDGVSIGSMQMTAVYDRHEARYANVEGTFRLRSIPSAVQPTPARLLESDLSITDETVERWGRFAVSYDEPLSQLRTAQLRRLEEIRNDAARSYEAYAAHHTAEFEIVDALGHVDVHAPSVPPAIRLHLDVNPVLTWRTILAQPASPRRHAILSSLRVGPDAIPDEAVPLIRDQVGRADDVDALVAGLADERFLPQIRRLSRTGSGEVRDHARQTLAELTDEPATREAVLAATEDAEAFRSALASFSRHANDPRPIASVLIEALGRPALSPEVKGVCEIRLAALTFRALDDDVVAWQRFWTHYRDLPYERWIADAASSVEHVMHRLRAVTELGDLPPSLERRRILEANLQHPSPPVRATSAGVLLRWGDPRGLPELLTMLKSPRPFVRAVAFQQLARVGRTTLGFDPRGPEPERVAAAARWQRWAESSPGSDANARANRGDPGLGHHGPAQK